MAGSHRLGGAFESGFRTSPGARGATAPAAQSCSGPRKFRWRPAGAARGASPWPTCPKKQLGWEAVRLGSFSSKLSWIMVYESINQYTLSMVCIYIYMAAYSRLIAYIAIASTLFARHRPPRARCLPSFPQSCGSRSHTFDGQPRFCFR